VSDTIPECEACRPDAPKLGEDEITRYARQVPEWRVETVDGVAQLHRDYGFKNFAEALAFSNDVGALAEEIGHHPELVTGWGHVTVKWWSHKIRGLHELDFAMARRCDRIAGGGPASRS
jgi:4a-hydroxytetrahydrobiopterin dehydratase